MNKIANNERTEYLNGAKQEAEAAALSAMIPGMMIGGMNMVFSWLLILNFNARADAAWGIEILWVMLYHAFLLIPIVGIMCWGMITATRESAGSGTFKGILGVIFNIATPAIPLYLQFA